MDSPNSKERERFGEAYRGYTEEHRVPPDRLPFFTRKNSPENDTAEIP
jgi:hypothetical protein